MVSFIKGDILEDTSQVLVNPVNCVGVMGKGLALSFKKKFPYNFLLYQMACFAEEVIPGQIFVTPTGFQNPSYIFNFPTKNHWANPSSLEYISFGLMDLEKKIKEYQVSFIAIPPLGCGLGGLDWNQVKPLILKTCEKFPDVNFRIYEGR